MMFFIIRFMKFTDDHVIDLDINQLNETTGCYQCLLFENFAWIQQLVYTISIAIWHPNERHCTSCYIHRLEILINT